MGNPSHCNALPLALSSSSSAVGGASPDLAGEEGKMCSSLSTFGMPVNDTPFNFQQHSSPNPSKSSSEIMIRGPWVDYCTDEFCETSAGLHFVF